MNNPTVRLVVRAILVGITTCLSQLSASSSWDRSLVSGAIVGGVLATAEALTPLNSVVGVGKTPAA